MDLLNFEEEEAAAYGKGCRPYESAHPCLHARQNPLCESGKIDYLRFYFCSNEIEDLIQPGMKAPVLIAWAIILFSTIAIVADCFFAPAIRTIAKMFKLPDDVAGATLLALGGSAPDIFTQLAAMLVSEKPDFNLAMSESVGAGIYVCSLFKRLHTLLFTVSDFVYDVYVWGDFVHVWVFVFSRVFFLCLLCDLWEALG